MINEQNFPQRQHSHLYILLYYLKDNVQVAAVDQFLKNTYLPALHRAGILKVGVFKPFTNDTAQVKKIYVFIPFHSLSEWQKLPEALDKDESYQSASKDYINFAGCISYAYIFRNDRIKKSNIRKDLRTEKL